MTVPDATKDLAAEFITRLQLQFTGLCRGLEGFAMRIGRRAALVPAPGSCVHGVLVSLTLPDLHALYSDPGVREYRPHAVIARLAQGETVPALCYTLPEPPVAGERDADYATALREVGRKAGLPTAYLDSID